MREMRKRERYEREMREEDERHVRDAITEMCARYIWGKENEMREMRERHEREMGERFERAERNMARDMRMR